MSASKRKGTGIDTKFALDTRGGFGYRETIMSKAERGKF